MELQEGTICAIATAKTSNDVVWFVKINTEREVEDIIDDYGNHIKAGTRYYSGNFLESWGPCGGCEKFQLMEKNMFFFKESVVNPFAPFKENKGHHIISSED